MGKSCFSSRALELFLANPITRAYYRHQGFPAIFPKFSSRTPEKLKSYGLRLGREPFLENYLIFLCLSLLFKKPALTIPQPLREIVSKNGFHVIFQFEGKKLLEAWVGQRKAKNRAQNAAKNVSSTFSANFPCVFFHFQSVSGLQKGPAERGHVKERRKSSKSFSTLFDNFRAGHKASKIVKKRQKAFRHFSTTFARHLFSGPFCNPLRAANVAEKRFPKNSTWIQHSTMIQSGTPSSWSGKPKQFADTSRGKDPPKTDIFFNSQLCPFPPTYSAGRMIFTKYKTSSLFSEEAGFPR